MNSIRNGLLLCPTHHAAYDHGGLGIEPHVSIVYRRFFMFVNCINIHPHCSKTHKIYAISHHFALDHGKEVTVPWDNSTPGFPSPSDGLLEAHIMQALYKGTIARAVERDLYSDHEDDDPDVEPQIVDTGERMIEQGVRTSRIIEYVEEQRKLVLDDSYTTTMQA